MKKQNLGKSSLQISPLCLGLSMGHNDFSEQGQQQFNQLINRALDLGLNFLDSSDAYWNGLHETW
jgi:aryl-alcohol dehydrogenase-like predicted oxidoreductase